MKRRVALTFAVGAPLLFQLRPLRAQQPAVLDTLQQASVRALTWFKSLMEPISQIVAIEERNQLLDALSDLSKDLYGIEQDKTTFLQVLKRDPIDKNTVYSQTVKLMKSIDQARGSLRRLGPLLRVQSRVGGVEVEALLSDAAVARKVWVSELYDLPTDSPKRSQVLAQGEDALKALRAANIELSKLISRL